MTRIAKIQENKFLTKLSPIYKCVPYAVNAIKSKSKFICNEFSG